MFNKVKVFHATTRRNRELLGDVITEWLRSSEEEVIDYQVRQTSDREYHCVSLVFFLKGQNT